MARKSVAGVRDQKAVRSSIKLFGSAFRGSYRSNE